jgi:hypothetical protein
MTTKETTLECKDIPCDLAKEILDRLIMPMWDRKSTISWGIVITEEVE